MPISGPIVQAKAIELHRKFENREEDFSVSDGWVDRSSADYSVLILIIIYF